MCGLTDQQRTMRELVKAMSSLLDFIQLEGEVAEMFGDRLPTLDTEIWVCDVTGEIRYSFFEKPTVPNRLLQKDTALNEGSIRASLVQEVIRRLKNCSLDLPLEEKQQILSVMAQKLINGGFSLQSAQYILVHGVVKYKELVRLSQIDPADPEFKPLHLEKEFNVFGRKLQKMLAVTSWYEEAELVKKTKWRKLIPKGWSGDKPSQHSVPGMRFSTLMQVPSSKDGRLFKMLTAAEPRLAKMSGYQVKYVESSGKPLSKVFPPIQTSNHCHRKDCFVCLSSPKNKPSMCKAKSVVYSITCELCEKTHKQDPSVAHKGLYIGESARTLYERSIEHMRKLRRMEDSSCLFKHWAITHPELLEAPSFLFKVIKKHSDPLSRMINEAITILKCASMNSKSEYRGYKLARLTVSQSEWQTRKEVEIMDREDKVEKGEMLSLKNRVVSVARSAQPNNQFKTYRKRRMIRAEMSSESQDDSMI